MKRYAIALIPALFVVSVSHAAPARVIPLCGPETATGLKAPAALPTGAKTFQASVTVTSGSGTAAVTILGSNDGTWYDSIGTLAPSNTASDSITVYAPAYWKYRCSVTGISGTGAAVTVTVGN